jgi:hypothetical protein
MTYLQLTFRGIPAAVIRGNTLSLATSESAWTPPTAHFYSIHGKLFSTKEAEQTPSKKSEPPPIVPNILPGQTQQLRFF